MINPARTEMPKKVGMTVTFGMRPVSDSQRRVVRMDSVRNKAIEESAVGRNVFAGEQSDQARVSVMILKRDVHHYAIIMVRTDSIALNRWVIHDAPAFTAFSPSNSDPLEWPTTRAVRRKSESAYQSTL
jgi:hypothetical protein